MLFDFLLSAYSLGYSQGQVRAFDASALCTSPRGLTGTEVTMFGLAEKLASLGHAVRVYTCWKAEGVIAPRLEAYQIAAGYNGDDADVAVAFHDASPLSGWPAPIRLCWHQTVIPPHSERMAQEPVDAYIASTEVSAQHLSKLTPDIPWYTVPNGWDYGLYPEARAVPGRIFYHTSAERGLHLLLKAYPLIRRRVHKAHLVVYTRLETVKNHHSALWHEIEDEMGQPGMSLELHPNGAARNVVLEALARAQVLAYPSEPDMPCEVMPLSVMEACALGVPVVTAPSDGFEQAYGNALDVCPSPPSTHLETFAQHVVEVLTNYYWRHDLGRRGNQWAKSHTFARTAQLFLAVVDSVLRHREGACSIDLDV